MVRKGGARTLYIDDDVWEQIQQLVKLGYAPNASKLVNRLLAEALDTLLSSGKLSTLFYQALKLRHLTLALNVCSLEKKLKKNYGAEYQALLNIARTLGLDFMKMHNLDVVAPKIVSQWKGSPTPLHLFLTLLENAKEKRALEMQLSELRKKIYSQNVSANA